jgi:chorismate mutase
VTLPNENQALEQLHRLRDQIEAIDTRFMGLVAERVRLARLTTPLKTAAGQPVTDPAREAAVVRRAGALGREVGLEEDQARALLWQIIAICRQAQSEQPPDGR